MEPALFSKENKNIARRLYDRKTRMNHDSLKHPKTYRYNFFVSVLLSTYLHFGSMCFSFLTSGSSSQLLLFFLIPCHLDGLTENWFLGFD